MLCCLIALSHKNINLETLYPFLYMYYVEEINTPTCDINHNLFMYITLYDIHLSNVCLRIMMYQYVLRLNTKTIYLIRNITNKQNECAITFNSTSCVTLSHYHFILWRFLMCAYISSLTVSYNDKNARLWIINEKTKI